MKVILDIDQKTIQIIGNENPKQSDLNRLNAAINTHRYSDYTLESPVMTINAENNFTGRDRAGEVEDFDNHHRQERAVTVDELRNTLSMFGDTLLQQVNRIVNPVVEIWHNGDIEIVLSKHTRETKKGKIKILKRFKYLYD